MGLLNDPGFYGTDGWTFGGGAGRVTPPVNGYSPPGPFSLPGSPSGMALLPGRSTLVGQVEQWFHVSPDQAGDYQLQAFVNANPAWLSNRDFNTTLTIDDQTASFSLVRWIYDAYSESSWWAGYNNAQYFPGGSAGQNFHFGPGWHYIRITAAVDPAATNLLRSMFLTAVDFVWTATTGGLPMSPTSELPTPLRLRLRHSSGRSRVDQDGETMQLRAAGVDRIKLPVPSVSGPPETFAGARDSDGVLVYFDNPLVDYALKSDLPPDTGELPLPGETVVTTVSAVLPTPVPSPTVDNCSQIRCGAAQMLAYKLVEQYTAIARMLNTFKNAPAFVKMLASSKLAVGGTGASAYIKFLKAWIAKAKIPAEYQQIVDFVEAAIGTGLFPTLIPDIAMLDDAQQQTIWQHAYESLTCEGGSFHLTQAMKQEWQDRMLLDTTTYPDDIMRHLLGWCIQLSPFYVYDLSAASGAQHPRNDCGVWD